ncbi:MAG: SRPBCC family protein [Chitinophagales bacterium]|nr:SRPBCC family protein [Chitinophagales bacterium]MDW8417917.1 SRPBCC family protein [Chitinophagales bacterium]
MHTLTRTQRLPISLERAWDFFSSPYNLSLITPPYMNFRILSNTGGEKMYEGQIITYRVSPLASVPLFWMTEITHVKEYEYFIDEQRVGPYAVWHHEHRFKAIQGGIEMTDMVTYKLPLGVLGKLVHALWVKRSVEYIFDYRYQALEERFGKFL